MSADEFYQAIVLHGPHCVWSKHYEGLLGSIGNDSEAQDKEDKRIIASTSYPPARASARGPLLFPRVNNTQASPGLHRAIIPKLYSLTTWHPRLYNLILPKYLLAMDAKILAHLYRRLGQLQPSLTPPSSSPDASATSDDREEQRDTEEVEEGRYEISGKVKTSSKRQRGSFETMVYAMGRTAISKLPQSGPEILPALIRGLVECRVYSKDPELLKAWEKRSFELMTKLRPSHLAEIAVSLGSSGLLPPPDWLTAFYQQAVSTPGSRAMGLHQLTNLMIGLSAMKTWGSRRPDGVKLAGAFSLLQASRDLLASEWPKSGSNVTAPFVLLSVLRDEIEWEGLNIAPENSPQSKPWVSWYCFYVHRVVEERPGLMRASDFITLLNTLANLLRPDLVDHRVTEPHLDSLLELTSLALTRLLSQAARMVPKDDLEDKDTRKMLRLLPRACQSIREISNWTSKADKDSQRSIVIKRNIEDLSSISLTASLGFITELDCQGLIEASDSALFLLQNLNASKRRDPRSDQSEAKARLIQAWAMASVLHSQSILSNARKEELLHVNRIITKLFQGINSHLNFADEVFHRTRAIPASWFVAVLDRATSIKDMNESDLTVNGSSFSAEGWTASHLPCMAQKSSSGVSISAGAWSAATSFAPGRRSRQALLLLETDDLMLLLRELLQAPGASEAFELMALEKNLRHNHFGRSCREILASAADLCDHRSEHPRDLLSELGRDYRLFLVKSM